MLAHRGSRTTVGAVIAVLLLVFAFPAGASGSVLPAGFQESVVFSGLLHPTVVRFSPDGRVFVAQKDGRILVFDSLADTTPTVFADLRGEVHDYWDRGLLGMALDPNFPATADVYVLYTYDAPMGGSPPTWGDACPTPPGPTTDGCVVSARLSRLTASGNVMTGSEQVLINDWCQQFPSHSIGSLQFGRDGALYVTAGDGASFNYVDYGQTKNPCADPPGAAGTNLTAPSAEGGALRSQDVRTPADPTSLDGSVLRIDKATGEGLASNPFAASTDANARRIIAYGLRNPFRATFRPGTAELWVGDVGWNTWEEIDRVVSPTTATNFGWPCYEGAAAQPGYDSANLNLCESLYGAGPGAVATPVLAYNHSTAVAAGDGCPTSHGSAVAGLAFAAAQSTYPAVYSGALFLADHNRNCIWAMLKGADGLPSASAVRPFLSGGSGPVNLEIGPGGDLFYPGYDGGDVRRISYPVANRTPTAVAAATPTAGAAPLTVAFDGTASSDPDPGDTIGYAWDFDGDGSYDDSTSATPTWTYTHGGSYTAGLQVSDTHGATATDALVIMVGNSKPTATIEAPTPATTWRVGQAIDFRGSATDPEQGTLPASALSWSLIIHHCTSGCHTHPVQTWTGIASGTLTAPDHDYPSYLELELTATDAGGQTDTQSVRLDPRTVQLTLASNPTGLTLGLNSETATTPFTRTVIEGSTNSLSASNQPRNKHTNWIFRSWSDGGAASHNVTANASATYTATYKKRPWRARHTPLRLQRLGRLQPAHAASRPGSGQPLTPRFFTDTLDSLQAG
jgi:glucose/arabinose dehydrogenase/PKD repeat protein